MPKRKYDPLDFVPPPDVVRQKLHEAVTLAERLRLLLEIAERMQLPMTTGDKFYVPMHKGAQHE